MFWICATARRSESKAKKVPHNGSAKISELLGHARLRCSQNWTVAPSPCGLRGPRGVKPGLVDRCTLPSGQPFELPIDEFEEWMRWRLFLIGNDMLIVFNSEFDNAVVKF